MTRLIVNGIAATRSSRGVSRYEATVTANLAWPGLIERLRPSRWGALDKARELTFRGAADGVLWSPTHRGPIAAARHVVTVHDCINLEYVYAGDWRETVVRSLTQRMLTNAVQVIAISEATKASVLRNYRIADDRIRVIRSSCEEDLSSIDLERSSRGIQTRSHLQHGRRYALMVTNALAHKNTAFACSALSLAGFAREGGMLRVVGALSPDAYEVCERDGLEVEVEPNVDNTRLAALYRNAAFVLAPSLAEGHNLVIAEALGCGAPVICSDIAAHREFYEGRVLMFDPTDTDDAVDRIRAVDEAPTKGLAGISPDTWSDVSASYRQVFDAVARA